MALFHYRYMMSGGADGELAAATRYLNQRYSMPNGEIIGILTDIGTEEAKKTFLAHGALLQIGRFQIR